MKKYIILIVAIVALYSCRNNKTSVEQHAEDTLMDSLTLKKKADTAVKMLDHLEDSINKLSEKATDKAGKKD